MQEQVDISDIMQTPEEEANHYLELQHPKVQHEYVESTSYKKLFYAKRSMKKLLEERTNLCFSLGLSSRNGKGKKVDREQMETFFGTLFKDGPDKLTEFSWTVVEDRGTIYGFLSCEDKFVPICKTCNYTVYVSLRGPIGRIACSNPQCKVKLLEQFELGHTKTTSTQRHSFVKSKEVAPSRALKKSQVLQAKNEQIQLSLNDKELIKRAAKKFVN